MLFAVHPLVIVLPLFLVQYMLAIFTLTRLALARLPVKYYVVWNICILLVFFIGSIVFLVYYYGKRKPVADRIIAEEDARAAAAVRKETQTDDSPLPQSPDAATVEPSTEAKDTPPQQNDTDQK